MGTLLAVGIVVPPIYIYFSQMDYARLYPYFSATRNFLRNKLRSTTSTVSTVSTITVDVTTIENTVDETYKEAIFHFIDDTEAAAPKIAFVSFCVGCVNIPLHLFLLMGAVLRHRWALLPWLIITMLEHIVLGLPFIIFFGIISLYMAAQLQLYVIASFTFFSIVGLFLLSLSSWFTVYAWYCDLGPEGRESRNPLVEYESQPLLPTSNGGPPLPPGHPGMNSTSYSLDQYPQYYPTQTANSANRGYPSAPPPTAQRQNGTMYPHLST